jgi:uracil-DNA glycosylase
MIYTYLIKDDWIDVFEMNRERISDAMAVVEKDEHIVPPLNTIFRPFQLTSLKDVRVVIVGQNPYDSSPGMANGLAFSLTSGTSRTIETIFKEVSRSYGSHPKSTNLMGWVEQGILLLNAMLTSSLCKPGINHELEWYFFMRHLVYYISRKNPKVVFMLWGKKAHDFSRYIKTTSDGIIKDPFPLERDKTDFVGSNTFVKCNKALTSRGCDQINWTV